jgi:pimeloyl-ACP methyl ester carboxylesterase
MQPQVLLYHVSGTGEPVVLVPGDVIGWTSWKFHQQRLARTHQAVRVLPIHNELGSYGLVGDPGYTAEIERESLRMTLDALKIGPAHLVGWSGGARALIEFALAKPDRVRTLTLIEPTATWIPLQLGNTDPMLDEGIEMTRGFAGRDITAEDLAAYFAYTGLSPTTQQAKTSALWEQSYPHRAALSWQGPIMEHGSRAVSDLATITCPSLLVHGRATAGWLKRITRELANRLPDNTLLELSGGHACHLEDPDEFDGAVQRHLSHVR